MDEEPEVPVSGPDYFNQVQGSLGTPTAAAMYHPGTLRQLPIYTTPLIDAGLTNPVPGSEGRLGLANIPLDERMYNQINEMVIQICLQNMAAEPEMCGGGRKSKVQKGGASVTSALAWGITASIITGTAFAGVVGWGAAEKVLAGTWFIPKLCSGTELMWAAFGLDGRGAQSCAARASRYAWIAKVLAAIFITSGGAVAAKFNPITIHAWVKDKLDNFYAFITRQGYQCRENNQEVKLMNDWLAQQDEMFYSLVEIDDGATIRQEVVVENNTNAKNAANNALRAASSDTTNQTWNNYWQSIVNQANMSSGGGKRRRRLRNKKSKNKKSKNKKTKRKMLKRKSSKRRKNKRNKTRHIYPTYRHVF